MSDNVPPRYGSLFFVRYDRLRLFQIFLVSGPEAHWEVKHIVTFLHLHREVLALQRILATQGNWGEARRVPRCPSGDKL